MHFLRVSIMNVLDKKTLNTSGVCPRCNEGIQPSKQIFRREFRCPQCGVLLYVSTSYLRTLFVLSTVVGVGVIAFAIGIRNPVRLFLFGIPLGFVALMLLVRLAPYFRPPVFQLRDPEFLTTLTTLDLASTPEEAATSGSSKASSQDRAG